MPMAVLFSCKECGASNLRVAVNPRRDGDPVLRWMEHVTREVMTAHAMHDLLCPATELQDLKIPCREDADWIGQDMPEDELERCLSSAVDKEDQECP